MTNAKYTTLLATLEERFENNPHRHPKIEWSDVLGKLENNPKALQTLLEMEESDGEPDVIGSDPVKKTYTFYDCAKETPKERRSLCYDQDALESRKVAKPRDSAVGMAERMGVELLSESDYRFLQTLGEFDLKTSSWIATPENIRELGGALFGDRRFDTVFIYHNGAESYYGARGFRAKLVV